MNARTHSQDHLFPVLIDVSPMDLFETLGGNRLSHDSGDSPALLRRSQDLGVAMPIARTITFTSG